MSDDVTSTSASGNAGAVTEARRADPKEGGVDPGGRAELDRRVEATPRADADRIGDRVTGAGDRVASVGPASGTSGVRTGTRPGEIPELASLADRVATFRPTGSDPNKDPAHMALRQEITERFTRVGDANGAAAFHSALSDITESPNMGDKARNDIRDYLGHFTKTDPAEMGALRNMAAGMVLSGVGPLMRGAVARGTAAETEAAAAAARAQRLSQFTNPAERRTAEYLETQLGRQATKNPLEGAPNVGRQGDAYVNGVLHEFKGLDPGATASTVRNVVNNSIRNGGQARNIVIDARGSGLDQATAERGVGRAIGISRGKIDRIEVIGDNYFITRNVE